MFFVISQFPIQLLAFSITIHDLITSSTPFKFFFVKFGFTFAIMTLFGIASVWGVAEGRVTLSDYGFVLF